MKKRILSVLLAITLMASLCTGAAFGYAEEYEGYAPAAEQKYSDVPEKHWAFKYIDTCSQYRYRDYTGSNVFEKWADWSSWSDAEAKEETNTKVETRTMYRFTVK